MSSWGQGEEGEGGSEQSSSPRPWDLPCRAHGQPTRHWRRSALSGPHLDAQRLHVVLVLELAQRAGGGQQRLGRHAAPAAGGGGGSFGWAPVRRSCKVARAQHVTRQGAGRSLHSDMLPLPPGKPPPHSLHSLRRAAPVDAGPANIVALDNGHLQALLHGVQRRTMAAHARPDDDQVVVIVVGGGGGASRHAAVLGSRPQRQQPAARRSSVDRLGRASEMPAGPRHARIAPHARHLPKSPPVGSAQAHLRGAVAAGAARLALIRAPGANRRMPRRAGAAFWAAAVLVGARGPAPTSCCAMVVPGGAMQVVGEGSGPGMGLIRQWGSGGADRREGCLGAMFGRIGDPGWYQPSLYTPFDRRNIHRQVGPGHASQSCRLGAWVRDARTQCALSRSRRDGAAPAAAREDLSDQLPGGPPTCALPAPGVNKQQPFFETKPGANAPPSARGCRRRHPGLHPVPPRPPPAAPQPPRTTTHDGLGGKSV